MTIMLFGQLVGCDRGVRSGIQQDVDGLSFDVAAHIDIGRTVDCQDRADLCWGFDFVG